MIRPLLLACLVATGCVSGLDDGFVCKADATCKPTESCIDRSCAIAAVDCPSGFRWSPSAGRRSGDCAEPPDLSVDPNCDNGVLDPGEACDDGPDSPQPCPTSCDDGDSCTEDVLVGTSCGRVCVFTYRGDGQTCQLADTTSGVCHNHSCCGGCWDGDGCRPGDQPAQCGVGGTTCTNCGANECVVPECKVGGTCGTTPKPQGSCMGGGGTCIAGTCCTTCREGTGQCDPIGTGVTSCGGSGSDCVDCQALALPCGPTDLGTRCVGCIAQCTGRSCGGDTCGGNCGTCSTNKTCNADMGSCACKANSEGTDTDCADGVDNDCDGKTDCDDADVGLACAGKRCGPGKFCFNAGGGSAFACTDGCRIGGMFYPPGEMSASVPCTSCNPAVSDSDWTAVADGTSCQASATVGGGNGTCRAGTCCTGCWIGSVCQSGTMTSACGVAGQNCTTCNRCSQACTGGFCVNNGSPTPHPCGPTLCCSGGCGKNASGGFMCL